MKLILSHPDLQAEGGVYIHLSVKEYGHIKQYAIQNSIQITEILKKAIDHILAPPPHNGLDSNPSVVGDLTTRESQVLALIAEGKTNKAIGIAMNLSEGTVKEHVHILLGKYNVDRRTKLAICYLKNHCLL